MSTLQDKYAFGSFELIPDRGVLLLDGVPVPMGSRAVKILTILAQQAGKVVSGQELLNQVWPEANVVESNLRVHLTNIRKHLLAATGETNAILTGLARVISSTLQSRPIARLPNSGPARTCPVFGRNW